MKRAMRVGLVVSLATLLIVHLVCFAQLEEPIGFAISDLQLISTASKPDWEGNWSAPVEAATILAWFHDHGYSGLLPDLNGDGVVDELDTIELADDLGKGAMKSKTPQGTSDALLVHGLAEYVADKYPDGFELKIYDVGFPAEYERELHTTFAPDVIPGITLVLETEPYYAAYVYELESGEGVILGIEEEVGRNYYLTGRSFLFEPLSENTYAVDLVWAEEDFWEPEIQGQVLETKAKQTDALYLYYQASWVKVECMLALSPIIEPAEGEGMDLHGPCPEGAIGYDVTTSTTDYGDVEIEECVIREGDIDTYIYTVRNISFILNDCGICWFGVPNTAGFPTLNQSGPATWLVNPLTWAIGGWDWRAPPGSCGIETGGSAVFSFSVPAPTTDVPTMGGVSGCGLIAVVEDGVVRDSVIETPADGETEEPAETNGVLRTSDERIRLRLDTDSDGPRFKPLLVRTTGPAEGPPDDTPNGGPCPDLTIKFRSANCVETDSGFKVSVTAKVTNIGGEDAGAFHCKVESSEGTDDCWVGTGLESGLTKIVSFSFTFSHTGKPPCLDLKLIADNEDEITDECDETNNTDTGSVCCEGPTGCPDLIISINNSSCSCRWVFDSPTGAGHYECTANVWATVKNIGTQAAGSSQAKLTSSKGSDQESVASLAPNGSQTVHFSITFTLTANEPPPYTLNFTVRADSTNKVDESCYPNGESNNTATGSVRCTRLP